MTVLCCQFLIDIMKQRLHIHFGIHRTGTTSIHKCLFGNLQALDSMGVCYPEMGVGHRHVKLAWEIMSGKTNPKQLLKKIKMEVKDTTRLVILSSEDFSRLNKVAWLELLKDEFDLTASVYLKRQDLWLESWYNQNIKWPWDKRFSSATPDMFLEHAREFFWIDYKQLLMKITDIIPEDKVYVDVVDSNGVKDTVSDFLLQCGIDQEQLNSFEVKNESLSAVKLDIIRRINLLKVKPAGRRRILAALQAMEIKEDDGSKDIFTDEQVLSILNMFSESNDYVAKTFFNRSELFSDEIRLGRDLCVIPDRKVCRVYMPKLLKAVAQS